MIWVIVFAGIGLAGLIMLISYAVWLAHKASDLFSELDVLATRAGDLADLLSQIRIPETALVPDWQHDRIIAAEIDRASAT
jgi:hypothetical protein